MPSCESLRFTLANCGRSDCWREEAQLVTIPLLRRTTSQLRHLNLNSTTAVAVLEAFPEAFANIEYYSLDEWDEHIPSTPSNSGGDLEEIVDVVRGMPKLKVLAITEHDIGMFEDSNEMWAPLAERPIVEMPHLKLALPAPPLALAKWQDFIRHCPRLVSVDLSGLSPRATWPDDSNLPPLKRLTLNHKPYDLGESRLEASMQTGAATLFVDCTLPQLECLTVHGWQAAAAEGVTLADRVANLPRLRRLDLVSEFSLPGLAQTLSDYDALVGDDVSLDLCPALTRVSLKLAGEWPQPLYPVAKVIDSTSAEFPFNFPPLQPLDIVHKKTTSVVHTLETPPRINEDGGAAGRWRTCVSVRLVGTRSDAGPDALWRRHENGGIGAASGTTAVEVLVVRTRD